MKTLLQTFSVFAFVAIFLVASNAAPFLEAQEEERSRAEIELAEELEIEMRQLEDLQARLKAEKAKSRKQAAEEKAKEASKKKATTAKARAKRLKELQSKKNQSKEKSKSGFSAEGSIKINGKEIDLETFLQKHGKELESWAEKHASDWEKWAEKFESNMEGFANEQEHVWEKWADDYSKRWENWAAGLESGDFDPKEMHKLIDKNLEMLSEMPLDNLIEGALKEGLGELKNAPWQSLGELHELVGGSIEQALSEMEKEIELTANDKEMSSNYEMQMLNGTKKNLQRWFFDSKSKTFRSKRGNLESALKLLQEAIQTKSKHLDADSAERLNRIKQLLEQGKDIDEKTVAETMKQLEQRRALQSQQKSKMAEMLENVIDERNSSSEQAKKQYLKALELMKKQRRSAEDEKGKAMSLEKYMSLIERETEKLKAKETEIEKMRREIEELRREVQQMRKDKS